MRWFFIGKQEQQLGTRSLLKSEGALAQIFLSKHSLSNQTETGLLNVQEHMSFQILAQALD